MPDQAHLLRLPVVLARTGLSRSQLYRLVAAGRFPRPVGLGGTAAKAWSSAAVSEWIRDQLQSAESARL
ncbi:helix-turn-helix transcriptional regulator [Mesorhizobium australicum]|uniref:Transcriptional regulator, AlpA family n=1 Tax=Mesorhizobium australicum TaxID=536018 RepID=A0A1X7P159_9HYPH|nr:AlpA family phage regulatory protein [Mesorhizobium australicum]SMH43468.1 transcriptional regulator, AlpA family [Mesorhizobium australicum]